MISHFEECELSGGNLQILRYRLYRDSWLRQSDRGGGIYIIYVIYMIHIYKSRRRQECLSRKKRFPNNKLWILFETINLSKFKYKNCTSFTIYYMILVRFYYIFFYCFAFLYQTRLRRIYFIIFIYIHLTVCL